MRNPYWQVALTYLQDRYLWMIGALSAMVTLPMLILSLFAPGTVTVKTMAPQVIWIGFFALAACGHVLAQFTDPRARLTPGFARPHLVMAIAVSIVICTAWASVIVYSLSGSLVATLAMLSACYWLMSWCLIANHWTGIALWLGMALAPLSSVGQEALENIIVNSAPVAVLALAAVAVGACYGTLGRLTALTEEQPIYHRHLAGGWDQNLGEIYKARGNHRVFRGLANFSVDRRVDAFLRRPALGRFWAVERWRVPLISLLPQMIWMGLLTLIVYGLLRYCIPDAKASAKAFDFVPAILGLGWATMGPGIAWRPRRAMMGQDLLRPVTRAQMFRQMGTGLAVDAFLSLLIATVFVLALFWFEHPRCFLEMRTWLILAICWSWALFAYGWSLWAMRFRSHRSFSQAASGSVYFGILLVGVILFQGKAAVLVERAWGLPIGVTIGGLMLAYTAYRRWLVADLE